MISNAATCIKTVVKAQPVQQLVCEPYVDNFLQTTSTPVVENINYLAVPTNCPPIAPDCSASNFAAVSGLPVVNNFGLDLVGFGGVANVAGCNRVVPAVRTCGGIVDNLAGVITRVPAVSRCGTVSPCNAINQFANVAGLTAADAIVNYPNIAGVASLGGVTAVPNVAGVGVGAITNCANVGLSPSTVAAISCYEPSFGQVAPTYSVNPACNQVFAGNPIASVFAAGNCACAPVQTCANAAFADYVPSQIAQYY